MFPGFPNIMMGSGGIIGDPYWDNVSLLVRGDTLTDLSANGHTLTASGNAAAGP